MAADQGASKGCFAEMTADKELIPREPGFAESLKTMGFVIMSSGGFAFEGARLAWRIGEQLSIWSWRDGALALEKGGSGRKQTPTSSTFRFVFAAESSQSRRS